MVRDSEQRGFATLTSMYPTPAQSIKALTYMTILTMHTQHPVVVQSLFAPA